MSYEIIIGIILLLCIILCVVNFKRCTKIMVELKKLRAEDIDRLQMRMSQVQNENNILLQRLKQVESDVIGMTETTQTLYTDTKRTKKNLRRLNTKLMNLSTMKRNDEVK